MRSVWISMTYQRNLKIRRTYNNVGVLSLLQREILILYLGVNSKKTV